VEAVIRVELPYPHKALWPNGRAHWGAKAKQTAMHRAWGWKQAYNALHDGSVDTDCASIPIKLIVSRKSKGVYPDKDNCVAAAKAYLDGIAEQLKVNDAKFAAPTVEFVPQIGCDLVIEVGT
jgi:hypothetical protein